MNGKHNKCVPTICNSNIRAQKVNYKEEKKNFVMIDLTYELDWFNIPKKMCLGVCL